MMNSTKTIRLPSDLHRRLKAKAAIMGKTIIDYISGLIKGDDPTSIPSNDFTDEEISRMMEDQEKREKENPGILKWAQKKASGKH